MCGFLSAHRNEWTNRWSMRSQFNISFSCEWIFALLTMFTCAHSTTSDNWLNSEILSFASNWFAHGCVPNFNYISTISFSHHKHFGDFFSFAWSKYRYRNALDHIWCIIIDMHAQMPKEFFSLECTPTVESGSMCVACPAGIQKTYISGMLCQNLKGKWASKTANGQR